MSLFREPTLGRFASSVRSRLLIVNLSPELDLLRLRIAGFGKQMSVMVFILMILPNQILRKISWKGWLWMAWQVAAGDLKGLIEFILPSVATNLEVLANRKLIFMFI